MAEETIILDVQVDQADAQKQLVATEKAILALRKEAADLRKEYNAGKISEDEYVEANLRLQSAIKKETAQKTVLNKLVETESNSRNALKLRVSALTKEYDNLNKSTDAGAKRADELQKELTQLNSEITKTSKSAGLFKDQIGNYPEKFTQVSQSVSKATEDIQPFGLSVESTTASVSKFITPAGAALGLLTGLATAYASSAVGAKDLQTASDTLSAATSILTNRLGDLIGVTEEGQGVLTTFTQGLLFYLDSSLGVESAIQAAAKQTLRDLQLSAAFAQAEAKNSERRAENARRIRDDESKSLDERLSKTKEIDAVLEQSAQRSVIVLQAQIQAIKDSTTNYSKNRDAQLEVAQLEAEIADKQEEINGKLTENVTARRAILKLIQEQAELEKAVNIANVRAFAEAPKQTDRVAERLGVIGDPSQERTKERIQSERETQAAITGIIRTEGEQQIIANQAIQDGILAYNKQAYQKDLEAKRRNQQLKQQVELAGLDATAQVLGAAASLFDQSSAEFKIIQTAQTLIATYSSAVKAFESQAAIPIIGPELGAAAAAAAIALGLAQVAQINGVQFAEGGFTGVGGKYEPAGIVHKGEYVVPQSVNYNPAAQHHIKALESMRVRGYADGGFVASESISASQTALMMANAIRELPVPELSVVEVSKAQNRISVREKSSRL